MNKKILVSAIAISTIIGVATLSGLYIMYIPKTAVEPPILQKNTPITQTTSDKCVITLDGKSYDVTEFRKIHEGGDIFDCGQDNTEKFYSEHTGGTVEQMRTYLID